MFDLCFVQIAVVKRHAFATKQVLHLENSWILRGLSHRTILVRGMSTARPRYISLSCCRVQQHGSISEKRQTCVLPVPVAGQDPAPAALVLVQHLRHLGSKLVLGKQPPVSLSITRHLHRPTSWRSRTDLCLQLGWTLLGQQCPDRRRGHLQALSSRQVK